MLLVGAATARGQCTPGGPPSPRAVRGSISGVVMDTSHLELDNVEVVIRQPNRRARSEANGRFRLDSLAPGNYELIVRRIGYEMALQTITVTDSGGVARFCLIPDVKALQPMITSVFRGGLSGVIGDTTYAMVPGAEVRIMGMGLWTHSDSSGAFYLPVKKGTYAVVVTKKPYGQQLLSVTVPEDSGRKIAVWLGSRPRNANTLAIELDGIRQRVMRTPQFRYHIVSAEELSSTEMSLTQAVRVAGRTNVQDDCEAKIGGEPLAKIPLYMLAKDEIAMMEVVTAPLTKGSQIARTPAPGGFGTRRLSDCPTVIVWLKR
jgi:hypothetical protein